MTRSDTPGSPEPKAPGRVLPSRASLFATRLVLVYVTLYILTTPMLWILLPIPGPDLPSLTSVGPALSGITWVTRRVFHVGSELVVEGSGSGDKTFDWVCAFCLAVIAIAAAAAWTGFDRSRRSHTTLQKWCRLLVRLALGATMISYGLMKVVPVQMSFPSLIRLVQPYGSFSPMGVLWAHIGASPSYETFLGCMETIGGILVLIPTVSTLGALLCLANAVQVFVLNMTYDVPVKLFSFHLILLALVAFAPHCRRFVGFVLDRPVGPAPDERLFRTAGKNRLAFAAQAVFALLLVVASLVSARAMWREYGGGAPRSPLYGIWDVTEQSIDGTARPPLLTDRDRWRRAIFEGTRQVAFQRMDDSFGHYGLSLDEPKKTLTLSKSSDAAWKGSLRFERPALDRLVLDGTMGGGKVRLELARVEHEKLPLVSRGFHWVQEYPFNR